ncbi:MAG: hypothetical protein ACHQIL_05925 [Steroidobacterales bacterium]
MSILRPGFPKGLVALLFLVTLAAGTAQAQVLLDQTSEIGTASVAPPVEYTFTATSAQALTVTLTDLQQPAALASLQIAVTLGDAVVGTATLASGASSATVNIPGAAGNYGLHVIGTPTGSLGLGSFGVCVAPQGTPSSCIAADSFSGNIQAPAVASTTGVSTLSTTFTSSVAGTYTVTLTDDAFPVALSAISAAITQGSTPVITNIQPGVPTTVTLSAVTPYDLFVAAQANATTLAGLYGIQITDPNGQVVFGRTLPVGTLGPSTIVANPTAQSLHLTLNDLAYPAGLTSVGAVVTAGAVSYSTLTAAGTGSSFAAPAGNLEIWQYAVAAALTTGVYSLTLATTSGDLYTTTQVVQSSNTATATIFAYLANIPTAGTYTVAVNDFQLPSLQFLKVTAVAQNGTAIPVSSNGSFSAVPGPLVVLVTAQPANGASGIFAVTVGQSGSPLILDQTQAVGGVFNNQVIKFGSAGTYNVTLADLGFPSNFQNLAAVFSNNGQVLGKIYGGGTFPITLSPGQYQLTFIAVPGAQNYGLYSIHIAAAAPSVTLTASASSVSAGQPVQLTWSSSGATSCTAGGATGWSGSEATSGTLGLTIDATVTLTLTCTGPGGTSAPQSVKVTATGTLPSSGGGGGGSLDPAGLWALMGLTGLVAIRRRAA